MIAGVVFDCALKTWVTIGAILARANGRLNGFSAGALVLR